MKKLSIAFLTSLFAIGIIILFCLAGCKKTNDGHTASDNEFSFNYNGSQYKLAPINFEYSVDSMHIQISRPDIFDGVINFQKPDCAYYATNNELVNVSGNCHLTKGSGLPIDSAAVYIYKTGSLNVVYSNCSSTSLTDLSGRPVTAQYCDMEGSFDLTLKNSENKLVTISDGHFIQYHMLRSWK